MMMSRRQFLALSATVLAGGCATSGPSGAPADSAETGTTPPPTTAATAPAVDTASAPTQPSSTEPSSTGPTTEPPPALTADPFRLGVSSGDPGPTSVVLWTRLIGDELPDEVDVAWELLDGASVVASGTVPAFAVDAHSVRVVVELDRPLHYRFTAGGFTSPNGWTQPATERDELRIASAGCQHFETGYYSAHRDIAEWKPDLVLFLGDFIYEGAPTPVGTISDGVEVVRSHEGPEPETLDAYRARYATYLGDADLQASRAVAPWLVIWDDHEVENNYAGDLRDGVKDTTGFLDRRADAYRAWWEHMPTRLPAPVAGRPYAINRTCDYGGLATITVVDGRQFRSEQSCGSPELSLDPPCDEVFDEQRTMLGAEQEAWLADRFAAVNARWNVLGQQTVLTDTRLNDAILNYDQWDGYPAARDRLLASAPPDLIVITGDIHLAGVGQIGTPGSPGSGVEFVTTSLSSTSNVPPTLEDLVRGLPNIVDAELVHRGSIRHTVTADRWTADYRIVDDVSDPASALTTWKSFTVEHGTATATPAT